ncbi:MAG TPA: response regulator [Gammaproteobacteria bacterium]|nr:response regulator [Gammaproteobacteria bacterium]
MELPAKPRVDFSRKRFLVIDDFGDMRSMLRHMVESYGVQRVDAVASGEEALRLMAGQDYDVILCDYNLGDGKDGQQVLEEAKHKGYIQFSTVFIMLTAENTMQMVMGAVEYYPDDYLSKPFNKETLRRRLERIILRKSDLVDVERLVQQGKLQEAIQLCEKRIATRPANLREFQKLKGELCLRLGRYEEAEALYASVVAERAVPWARLGLGKVYYHTGRLEAARSCFQDIIEDNHNNMEAHDWLAKTLLALGEDAAAQACLEEAAQRSPKVVLRQAALGEVAMKRKDYDKAARAFKKAVSMGRHSVYRDPAHYSNQARAMIHTRGKKDALRVLGRLRKDFPGNDIAALHAALAENAVLASLDRPEEAEKAYQEARRLFQSREDRVPPELALEMARTCIANGDVEEGTELTRRLVRNHHEDEALLRKVQAAFAEMGMEEEGRALISDSRDKVVKLNNDGVRLVQQGRLEEAIELFDEALQDMPANKTVNMNTAMVLLKYMEKHGRDDHYLGQVRRCLDMLREHAAPESSLPQLQERYQRLVKSNAA